MKAFFYILLIFVPVVSFGQQRTDKYGAYPESYGIVIQINPKNPTVQGSKVPRTAYEERMYKKLLATKLNKQEAAAWTKKEILHQQLSPTEQMYYLSAKRKILKRQQLLYKFSIDTSRFKSRQSVYLTPTEQQILQKAKDSATILSPYEQKLLKQALRKQKKIERFKQRYTLTDQDKYLLQKAKSDTAKLSLREKIKLLKAQQKQKRIDRAKLERWAAEGGWTPVKVSRTKRFLNSLIWASYNRPSSYFRKYRQLKRRYSLTENEKQALNKAKAGVPLTTAEKIRANIAYNKQWKFQQKLEKLNRQYIISLQDKETRKRLKQHYKQQMAKDRRLTFKRTLKYYKDLIISLF